MDSAISVKELSKTYMVNERSAGMRAALRGVFRRKKKEVKAVQSISLKIEPGEIVGFLGPNGAGKTTTLKMLSGLLHPTGGQALVLGYEPHKREKDFLILNTLVTGQRNQLVWDIPAIDSFEVNQAVYEIDRDQFKRTVDEYIELLELEDLVRKPVRQLSLVEPKDRATDLSRNGEIMSQDAGRISLRVPRKEVPEVAAKLLADVPMFDLSVEEPPIEDVIERVFTEGSVETSN